MSEADDYRRTEISPDGLTRLDFAISTGRMSHEIYSPRLTDIPSGKVILDLIGSESWDGSVRWLGNGDFTLTIRHYNVSGLIQLVVNVNRSAGIFTFGDPPGAAEPVADLQGRVPEAFREEVLRVDPPKRFSWEASWLKGLGKKS